MSLDRLPEKLNQIQKRIALVRGRGEEATKQALVLPFLEALGYDIWNPGEVCPEFEADFAIKKGGQKEKVDLAIVLDGEPRIFIEVKAIDTPLDGHEGQLARYFNGVQTVSLAILTNGSEYRFFTDSGEPNLLDSHPFFVLRLEQGEYGLEVLTRFHRLQFSPDAIRDYANELNYTARLVQFLRAELDLRNREPSDALVRWVLTSSNVYEGRMVSSALDRFRPTVKNALQTMLKEVVRRSIAALDEGVTAAVESSRAEPTPTATEPPEREPPASPPSDRAQVVTTDKELEAFRIIKEQLAQSALAGGTIFDRSAKKEVPIEIAYKDTTGYFNVYLNKPGWWVARLLLDGKVPWIGLNLPRDVAQGLLPKGFALLPESAWADVRVALSSVEDLHALNRVIFAALQNTVNERKPTQPSDAP